MEIYSCLDSEADLSQWGIEIPLLYSRPKQITSYLTKKLGANPVLEAKYKLLESKDLLLAHTKEYINKLTSNAHVDETMMNIFELVKDDGTFHRYKRENQKRPFSELFMHQLVEASGTFSCAKKAYLEKKDIHFLSGGMHHAMTDQGRGFCSLNDQVIAARKLQKENNLKDVWVIDLDVHKGDGTAECTKDDSSISTLSIHMKNGWPFDESWRPGPWDTPSTVDIEIGINQESVYLEKLETGLEELKLKSANPDLVFVAAGSDPYEKDALDSSRFIKLSKAQMLQRDITVYSFLNNLGVPQVWVMAGGYGEFSWEIYAQFLEKVLRSENPKFR